METEFDLTKREGRESYIKKCNSSFISDLVHNDVELSGDVACRINDSSITIFTTINREDRIDFASEVTIYFNDGCFDENKTPTISTGTCGSFDPKEDVVQFWKYTHMSSIMKNFDLVIKTAKKYREELRKLDNIKIH